MYIHKYTSAVMSITALSQEEADRIYEDVIRDKSQWRIEVLDEEEE